MGAYSTKVMVPSCFKPFSKPDTYSLANSSARRWLLDELLSTSALSVASLKGGPNTVSLPKVSHENYK